MNPIAKVDAFFARMMAPVSRALLYVCLFLFLATSFFGVLNTYLALNPQLAVGKFFVWQFLTQGFMHGGLFHLLVNGLILFFFGSAVEHRLGGRSFLFMVFAAIILAGMTHTVAYWGENVWLLGFSSAAFAILVCCLFFIPNEIVLLFGVLPMKLKYLVIGYLGWEVLSVIQNLQPGISNLGHLSGAVVGFAWILIPRYFKKGSRPRRGGTIVRSKQMNMGHPGRSSKPDDRYDDPHWRLDQ